MTSWLTVDRENAAWKNLPKTHPELFYYDNKTGLSWKKTVNYSDPNYKPPSGLNHSSAVQNQLLSKMASAGYYYSMTVEEEQLQPWDR